MHLLGLRRSSHGSGRARTRTVRPLTDLAPVFDAILRASVDRVVVVRGRPMLEDVLRVERRFVFALNHGPVHLPLVGAAALVRQLDECGGGEVRGVGVVFRGLYFVPGLGRFLRYVSQVDASPSFGELLEGFRADAWNGVVVMPEGANCAFGDPSELRA